MDIYPVQVHVRCRQTDIGPEGVVDEAALLVYFREARRAYVGALNLDFDPICRVVEAELEVLGPAGLDAELAVRVRCLELAERSFRLGYFVRDRMSRGVVAVGATSLVLDGRGDAVVVPAAFRERVESLEGRAFPLIS